jgi:oxygen-independent coproporphyrinogen-3 oxidase
MTVASLYVHVPFCHEKCRYCAFYSLPAVDAEMRARYLQRLDAELAGQAEYCGALATVYVGGGTPSTLTAGELRRLLGSIHRHFRLASGVEFTVECNVGSLTREAVSVLADAGVNRVSLGVQSFNPDNRHRLGRRDGGASVTEAVTRLRDGGIDNFNLDLIYGLPGQSLAAWEQDLAAAVALAPAHVSAYALTLEPGTPLAAQKLELPEERLLIRCWRLAGAYLADHGLPRYEISNYAGPDRVCRHNVRVWRGARFGAAGPAAAGFLEDVRFSNVADLSAWLNGVPADLDRLAPAERAAEILVTGLRLVDGWESGCFRRATGFDFVALRGDALEQLAAEGLLVFTKDHVRATERGLLLADYVARSLL